jgi:hypothetical protein
MIVCKSLFWRGISHTDPLEKKTFEINYLLFSLPSFWTVNLATQSPFAWDRQIHVRVIGVISELHFVASGSVISCVMSSTAHCLFVFFH